MKELQEIDCNCNNCKFMVRNMDKFKKSQEFNRQIQLKAHKVRQLKEDTNKPFQFDKKQASWNYGYCDKLEKDVQFIPNHCQIEIQDCFMHRKN